MRRIMAFGTFDLLHPGHVKYLDAARKLGDYLVVTITTDKNVEKLKGKKPVNGEGDRAFLVGSLKCVDLAVVGVESDFYGIVRKFFPTVLALGHDMAEKELEVKKELSLRGIDCEVTRMPAFEPEKNKSSKIKNRISDLQKNN